jgi:hypothetical protein
MTSGASPFAVAEQDDVQPRGNSVRSRAVCSGTTVPAVTARSMEPPQSLGGQPDPLPLTYECPRRWFRAWQLLPYGAKISVRGLTPSHESTTPGMEIPEGGMQTRRGSGPRHRLPQP